MVEGNFSYGAPVGDWTAWTPEGALAYAGAWTEALAAALPVDLGTPRDADPARRVA